MITKTAIIDKTSASPLGNYPLRRCEPLLVALSVIIILGSAAASVYLYPHHINWSICVGSGGTVLGLGILCFGAIRYYSGDSISSKNSSKEPAFLEDAVSKAEVPLTGPPRTSSRLDDIPGAPLRVENTPHGMLPVLNSIIHPYMKYVAAINYPKIMISEEVGFPIEELENRIQALNQMTSQYQKFDYAFCLSTTDSHYALVYINRAKRSIEYEVLLSDPQFEKISKILTRIAKTLDMGDKPFEVKINMHTTESALQTSPDYPIELQAALWTLYCFRFFKFGGQKDYPREELKNPRRLKRHIEKFSTEVAKCTETLNVLVQQARKEELLSYKNHYLNLNKQDKYLQCYERDAKKIPYVARLAQIVRGMRLDPISHQYLPVPLALPESRDYQKINSCRLPLEYDSWSKNPPPMPEQICKIDDFYDFGSSNWLTSNALYLYMQFLVFPHYPQITLPQVSCPLRDLNDKKAKTACCSFKSLLKNICALNQKTDNYQKVNYPFIIHVTGNHWTLVYVNRTQRTIDYYDSKINFGKVEYKKIIQELQKISEVLTQEEPEDKPFKVELKIITPLQPNDYQCGVWVLFFLDKILNEPQFNFNEVAEYGLPIEEKIAHYRTEVMHRLTQMRAILECAIEQEELDYKNFYKNENVGLAIYARDRNQLPCLLRWKQLAQGILLKP